MTAPIVRIEAGDMLDVLARLNAEGVVVQSVITDPPYHLQSIVRRFGSPDAAPAKVGATGAYARASAGFMGQVWDGGDIAFRPETWRLCYDLLPPGGHLLAFAGTRTYHRIACAIEDAGFEIRDMLAWLYGSGFPKSHNVGKAIDKRRTEDVEPTRAICRFIRAAMDARGLVSRDLTGHFGDCHSRLVDHWAARDSDSQPTLPTVEQWRVLKAVLSLGSEMDGEFARLAERKGERGDAWNDAEIIGEHGGATPGFGDHRFAVRDSLIRQQTDAARAWEGWGTALKPALEPLCIARKPLQGTVAGNVLAHGTGAFNIDACRIDASGRPDIAKRNGQPDTDGHQIFGNGLSPGSRMVGTTDTGRWPANVAHDGSAEVVDAFPDGASTARENKGAGLGYGSTSTGDRGAAGYADSGNASRFFYSSKADEGDRLDSKHPTVKPVDLIRWLVRLVTPPGGTVLDPFAGSGTTAMACMGEGFDCIVVEREPEYVADIRRRVAHVHGTDTPLFGGAK